MSSPLPSSAIRGTKICQWLQSSPFYVIKGLNKILGHFNVLKWRSANLGFMFICLLSAFGSANLFANGCKLESNNWKKNIIKACWISVLTLKHLRHLGVPQGLSGITLEGKYLRLAGCVGLCRFRFRINLRKGGTGPQRGRAYCMPIYITEFTIVSCGPVVL